MQARCQIRTCREQASSVCCLPNLKSKQTTLGFLTDSKSLSRRPAKQIQAQRPFLSTFFSNGLERAFTKIPANLTMFHPEAARRVL
jgi:hypothetical protein